MSFLGMYKEAAIECWTGLPGGGKSYQAAQLQVKWLMAGFPVVTNLAIRALPYSILGNNHGEYVLAPDEVFREVDLVFDDQGKPVMIDSDDSKGNCKRVQAVRLRLLNVIEAVQERNPGKHVLVVIDEAHNYYPASNTMATARTPDAIKIFLRQHRHMNCSVLAVVQNEAMLDNNFRMLTQCFRHHKNLVKDSWLAIILWWFGDNFHLAYSCANVRGKAFVREKFDRKWFRIKKSRASFYSTIQMHASDLKGSLQVVKGKGLRLVWLVMFLSVLFGIWKVLRFITGHGGGGEKEVAAVPAVIVPVKAPVQKFASVVSFFTLNDRYLAIVVDDDGVKRQVIEPYSDELLEELLNQDKPQIPVERLPSKSVGKLEFKHANL